MTSESRSAYSSCARVLRSRFMRRVRRIIGALFLIALLTGVGERSRAEESFGTKIKKIFAPTPTPAPRKHRKSSTTTKKKEGAEKSPTPKPSPTPEKSPSPSALRRRRKHPRVPPRLKNPSRVASASPRKKKASPQSVVRILRRALLPGRRSASRLRRRLLPRRNLRCRLRVRVPESEEVPAPPRRLHHLQRRKGPRPPSRPARSWVMKSIRQECARLSTQPLS